MTIAFKREIPDDQIVDFAIDVAGPNGFAKQPSQQEATDYLLSTASIPFDEKLSAFFKKSEKTKVATSYDALDQQVKDAADAKLAAAQAADKADGLAAQADQLEQPTKP